MNCHEVIELMQRYLDQDLDKIEYNQMLYHLEDCPECTELFQRLLNVSDQLESLPKVTPAFSLVDAILPKLQQMDMALTSSATEDASAYTSRGISSSIQREPVPTTAQPVRKDTVTVSRMNDWRSRTRGFVSAKIVGGVVAAGLILGFFVFNQQDQHNMENADSAMIDSKSASTSSASSREKSSTPAASGIGELNSTAPAAVSPDAGSGEPLSKQNEIGTSQASKDLVPPSSAPITSAPGNTTTPAPNMGSNKIGGAVPQTSSPRSSAADSQIMAVPSTGESTQQKSSSTPLQAGTGDGQLKEPLTFGAQPPAAKTDSPTAKGTAPPTEIPRSSLAAPGSFGGFAADSAQQSTSNTAPTNDSGTDKSKIGAAPAGEQSFSSMKVAPASSLAAVDKTYTAAINENRVVIIDKNGKLIFTSMNAAADTEQITLLEWTADYKLTYQIGNQTRSRTFSINAVNLTEAAK
ncbi:Putative zinc-finger [Paenibacillus sp. 1_12]|uniref:anti-sigma factor family protein n=1 Tax=Paenibacillus sp. 1_12 TaxID=1566278 RepID=UPI0008DEFF40|nr:zf-HC2 domain-containing protein [Paenibacillus sp. 1_12]SFL33597.1 Putative zinc-finger [Paenibacillus sp. 1_12]